jgi:arylsulfatase A-like enzyme
MVHTTLPSEAAMRTILIGAFVAMSLMVVPPLHAAERLNVVIILADDLGWADLGCYGSKYHKTPHLDKLASDGARFTQAYAACHVCSPTRAALLTGKYPARLNLTDWLPGRPDRPDQMLLRPAINQELPAGEQTLAAMLKAAGYITGHVGKWHLGGKDAGPKQRGFDVNIAGDQTGTPRSYFAPFKDKNDTFMPGLEKAPDGEYLTDRLTTEAEKFIQANRDKPFFLYIDITRLGWYNMSSVANRTYGGRVHHAGLLVLAFLSSLAAEGRFHCSAE